MVDTQTKFDPKTLCLTTGVGNGKTTACLISARALLDGRRFSDEHPSRTLRSFGIAINDRSWWKDDAERTAILMPLALDERLCASRCDVSPEAEAQRRAILVNWIYTVVIPRTVQATARAMEVIGATNWADELRALKIADAASAAEASSWCRFARGELWAEYRRRRAAADADAADAADAAADAAAAADAWRSTYWRARGEAYAKARAEMRASAIATFLEMLAIDTRKEPRHG